jgi:16S rRNA (cytosine967-C5)-methyltransferase
VLRGLAKAPKPAAPSSKVSRAELAAWTSFPDWMVDRFETIAGDSLPALLSAMNVPAPLTLRAVGERDALLAELAAAGISAKPGTHAPAAVLVDGGNPASFPGFAEGRFAIQDEAAQLVTLLLGDLEGHELLDCCAAPGGKAIHAAQLGANVLAVDASAKRLALVNDAAARLHTSLETLAGQVAESGVPGLGDRKFPRVLVDAPCSGTGILRRKPDIKWARRPEELSRLAGSQRAILEGAAKHLAPGGRLVYAVCSLLRDEGEGVVEPFLKAHPELRKGQVPGTFRTADGWFRSRPDLHGTDGFFAAVLERP